MLLLCRPPVASGTLLEALDDLGGQAPHDQLRHDATAHDVAINDINTITQACSFSLAKGPGCERVENRENLWCPPHSSPFPTSSLVKDSDLDEVSYRAVSSRCRHGQLLLDGATVQDRLPEQQIGQSPRRSIRPDRNQPLPLGMDAAKVVDQPAPARQRMESRIDETLNDRDRITIPVLTERREVGVTFA